MAEIAAVGLASSIVTFLDVSAKVLQRLRDYHAVAHDAPAVLRDTAAQVALVADILRRCKRQTDGGGDASERPTNSDESTLSLPLADASTLTSSRNGSLFSNADADADKESDDAAVRLEAVVDGCRSHVERLQALIDRMLPTDGDSRVDRTRKALASVWLERDVEDVQRHLARSLQLLNLYFSQRADAASTTAGIRGEGKKVGDDEDDVGETRHGLVFEIPSALCVARVVLRPMLHDAMAKAFGEEGSSSGAPGRPPTVVVLLGLGGEGKTQLALQYCRAARESRRYSFIAWLDSTSSDSVSRGLEALAAKIAPRRQFTNAEAKVAFVMDMLSRRTTPWLLVFDNYDQPSAFGNVATYFPQSSAGSILVTSRHAASERLGQTIRVTGMTVDEALQLILHQAGIERTESTEHAATAIVRRLGFLPLAIDQAGAYISARKLPLELFLEHYDERKEAVLKHTPALWEYRRRLGGDADGSQGEMQLSVFTTWDLSFQQLAGNAVEREHKRHFLTLAAFFDHARLGESTFRSHFEALGSAPAGRPMWINAFATDGKWDSHKFLETLAELSTLSLIQNLELAGREAIFSLHPLVADWLHIQADTEQRQLYATEAMTVLASGIQRQNVNALPLASRLEALAHVDAFLRHAEAFLCDASVWDVEQVRAAAYAFAVLYWHIGRFAAAARLLRNVNEASARVLGSTHQVTLDTLVKLGEQYLHLGDLAKAEETFLRASKESEAALGPGARCTLQALDNLGIVYLKQGQLVEAEAVCLRALAAKEAAFGPEGGASASAASPTLTRLGDVYRDQGKLMQAEAMYERASALEEAALQQYPWQTQPPDSSTSQLQSIQLIAARDNLAVLYTNRGRLAEAESLYERTLAERERALGPEHAATLDTLHNLGSLYFSRDRLADAAAALQRALVGRGSVLGPHHRATLDTANNLGCVYYKQRDLARAEELYVRTLAGREKALGPHDSATLRALGNLGNLYREQGKLAEAEELYQRALAGKEKVLGPEHPGTLDTMYNLARLYAKQNKSAAAEELYKRALAGRRRALKPGDPTTLVTLKALAALYMQQGKHADAEDVYVRALEAYTSELGSGHPTTIAAAGGLGDLYAAMHAPAKAEQAHRRAAAASESELGPAHRLTLECQLRLAVLLAGQAKRSEAAELLQQVLTRSEAALEPHDAITCDALFRLGRLRKAQGDLAAAAEMLRRALAGYEASLGASAEKTKKAAAELEDVRASTPIRSPRSLVSRLSNKFGRRSVS